MRNDFETGYLEHSAKGTTWKDHRYISKKLVNGKWVYYYNLRSDAAKGQDGIEINDITGKHGKRYRWTQSLKTRNKKSAMAGRMARAEINVITGRDHYGESKSGKRYASGMILRRKSATDMRQIQKQAPSNNNMKKV